MGMWAFINKNENSRIGVIFNELSLTSGALEKRPVAEFFYLVHAIILSDCTAEVYVKNGTLRAEVRTK